MSGFIRFFVIIAALLSASSFAAADELHPFVRGSWQEISAAHAGKAMVVHFWGLSCAPCRAEMPKWGKLVAERPDLNLILIHADLVPNESRAVTGTLVASGLARAENWIFQDSFTDKLRFEVDPTWRGELPLTLLLARDGTTTMLEGIADFGKVRAWLDSQNAQ
jgi:thiol-disulfide isomerase/thioredoxin